MLLHDTPSGSHRILKFLVFDVTYDCTLEFESENLLIEIEFGPGLDNAKGTVCPLEFGDEETGSRTITTNDSTFGSIYPNRKEIFGVKAG